MSRSRSATSSPKNVAIFSADETKNRCDVFLLRWKIASDCDWFCDGFAETAFFLRKSSCDLRFVIYQRCDCDCDCLVHSVSRRLSLSFSPPLSLYLSLVLPLLSHTLYSLFSPSQFGPCSLCLSLCSSLWPCLCSSPSKSFSQLVACFICLSLSIKDIYIWATAFLCEQGKNRDAPLLSETLQNKIHACKTR